MNVEERTDRPEGFEIWSDLHLGDMGTILAFDRPFEKPYEMDHVLIEAWCKAAEADDTTICLGDVSVDGCLQEHHHECWEQAPGTKCRARANGHRGALRIGLYDGPAHKGRRERTPMERRHQERMRRATRAALERDRDRWSAA